MLLRQELREPAVYNSILRAIGSGATRRGEIAARAGLEATAVSKYLATLERLDIIERVVPFGENPQTSRKGLYRFADACYDFWYTFVMPAVGDIEGGAGRIVAEGLSDEVLGTYLGHRFERVCSQWLLEESLRDAFRYGPRHSGNGGEPIRRFASRMTSMSWPQTAPAKRP